MNKRLENYMAEYASSHQNPTNVRIHMFAVPLIMFSVIGILKALPVPESWPLWFDWSLVLIAFALIFYATLKDITVFLSMVITVAVMVTILEYLRPHFFLLCLFIFVIAWIFQFIGHKIEGKKPSFFRDIFFLLIGPIWVLRHLTKSE